LTRFGEPKLSVPGFLQNAVAPLEAFPFLPADQQSHTSGKPMVLHSLSVPSRRYSSASAACCHTTTTSFARPQGLDPTENPLPPSAIADSGKPDASWAYCLIRLPVLPRTAVLLAEQALPAIRTVRIPTEPKSCLARSSPASPPKDTRPFNDSAFPCTHNPSPKTKAHAAGSPLRRTTPPLPTPPEGNEGGRTRRDPERPRRPAQHRKRRCLVPVTHAHAEAFARCRESDGWIQRDIPWTSNRLPKKTAGDGVRSALDRSRSRPVLPDLGRSRRRLGYARISSSRQRSLPKNQSSR
jgi:hypothetical protein